MYLYWVNGSYDPSPQFSVLSCFMKLRHFKKKILWCPLLGLKGLREILDISLMPLFRHYQANVRAGFGIFENVWHVRWLYSLASRSLKVKGAHHLMSYNGMVLQAFRLLFTTALNNCLFTSTVHQTLIKLNLLSLTNTRLRVLSHFSSGIVERARRERGGVKITLREKSHRRVSSFSRELIRRARVSLALLSLRKNGDYS